MAPLTDRYHMMGCIFRIFTCAVVLNAMALCPARIFAQSINPTLDCEGSAASYASAGIPCRCVNGQIVCDQPGHSSKKSYDPSQDIRMMVVGTLFETLLTSIFADNTASEKETLAAKQRAAEIARQQEALTRAQKAAAQAAFDQMMRSYKQLEGYQRTGFKTLSNGDLAFKSLDGDAEALAANARHPFDTASPADLSVPDPAAAPTPFFGDTMPIEDIRFLVDPESDPNIVDLREADTFVVQSLKNDEQEPAGAAEQAPGEAPEEKTAEAATPATACEDLAKRLNGYVQQRQKFQKTVLLAREQVDTWAAANRNALLNAAKDGLEAFTGHLFDKLIQRGLAADRLQQIYEINKARMVQEGLDVAEIAAKIERLKMISTIGDLSELAENMNEWQAFIQDGMSTLLAQLTDSNQEIGGMLDDPKLQEYFETEAPGLKTLLDISKLAAENEVFGKWVARKMPIIAGVELAINQSYNALDWFLSYQRIAEANQINGRVLEAARSIQQNIDDTSQALLNCR